ncbi:hypothetical protein EU545_05695 [Candidatus Thorarchaeota archaeon]|nr:MAG: hypothetical protein EU545_05695 [Candidatus Thorarchaeota archaeon]
MLPAELVGQFFGVGSLGEEEPNSPASYIKQLALPYAYQIPKLREEDMIRQFAALVDGFEEEGDFVFDIDIQAYREVTADEEAIHIDEKHLHSIHALMDGTHYGFFKTQQTAPATMAYSIRGTNGKQHLTEALFHFYWRLMKRIAAGQMEMLTNHCDSIVFCQDDPGLGHVKSMIEDEKIPDLSLAEIIARTDTLYPDDVIPAYHYCDDWRKLRTDDKYVLWDAKPKIVHLDLVRYTPSVDADQAEKINAFMKRGGGIALGILPNVDEAFSESLLKTLEHNLASSLREMEDSGIDVEEVARSSMISTQCGLSGASISLTREIHSESHKFPEVFNRVMSKTAR